MMTFLAGAATLLKRIPWQLWAIVLVALAIWSYGHLRYRAGVGAERARWEAAAAQERIQAEQAARAIEQRHAQELSKITTGLIAERNKGYEERDATIAGLRAGSLRLRDKFRCPAETAGAGPTAAGGDAAERTVLSREDQEFLVRLGSEADDVVRQLTACQGVVRAYNKAFQGQPAVP